MLKVKFDLGNIKGDDFFNRGNLIISKDLIKLYDVSAIFVSWSSDNEAEGLLFKENGELFDLVPVAISTEFTDDEKEIVKSISDIDNPSTIEEIFETFLAFFGEHIEECDFNSLKDFLKFALDLNNKFYNGIWGDINNDRYVLHLDICSEIAVVLDVTTNYQTMFLEGYFVNKETDKRLSEEKLDIRFMTKLDLERVTILDILDNLEEDYLIKKIYECL